MYCDVCSTTVKSNTVIILQFKNTFYWLWFQVALSILYFLSTGWNQGRLWKNPGVSLYRRLNIPLMISSFLIRRLINHIFPFHIIDLNRKVSSTGIWSSNSFLKSIAYKSFFISTLYNRDKFFKNIFTPNYKTP